ncbi:MAG: hypothetical protein E5X33_04545 [Mesorhizobium sp.]|uniref:hypothetical protein n=1 Tax=Mesorhizobium sp. TaxID=1871066 RepID=UPI000FE6836F|nr:hypothetical protein [Mesorhizobium sp.]RWI98910.1 MAG: hypothetical protein EOR22_02370 [Mesorhizobium sp.]TIR23363.1 MAG: hypothetical protein E5X33_04545 [Mesorhizobium sp.]
MKACRVEEMDGDSVVARRTIKANTPWVAAEAATGSEVTNTRGDEQRWVRVTDEAAMVVYRYAFK